MRYPFLWDEFGKRKVTYSPTFISKIVRENKRLASIASKLKPMLENLLDTKFVVGQPFDIERSLAFSIEDSTGAIYVNRGLSENERENIKKEIISKIKTIGEIECFDSTLLYGSNIAPTVADIYLKSDRYWITRGLIGTVFSDVYIAHHRREGVLTLIGEAFSDAPDNARIMDIAPTILHIMGCPIPKDMDGVVLTKALSSKYNRDIIYEEPEEGRVMEDALSQSEQEIIEERLRKLGYI